MEIRPLLEHELPITAVQYFNYIKENSDAIMNGSATDYTIEQVLKSVWNLYWEMTENIQFR